MAGIETEVLPGTVELLVDGSERDAGGQRPLWTPVEPPAIEMGDLDRRVRLARRLAETRIIVDRVLETVSESRLEARRLVTKELGVDPRPEVLNTIVKVACDKTVGGLRRELPRHLLTVESLIEHELACLLDRPDLDADALCSSREILPDLLHLSRQIQEDITTGMEALTHEARDYLLQVCNSLCAPEEKVSVAVLLAPRLALFARTRASGGLLDVVPSLREDEVRLLTRLFESGPTDEAPARACLNSIALRSMMSEDIARWEAICADAAGPGASVEVQPDYLERMGQEKAAFHFISERLQDKQDAALQAGLPKFAEEVRAFRQSLFATNLEFTPALRDATAGRASETAATDDSALATLVEAAAEADAASDEARSSAPSKEELYLRALTDMRRSDASKATEPLLPYAAARRSDRRRLAALACTAGVLAAICAMVYVPMMLAPAPQPEVSMADFASTLAFTEMVAVGSTMYARVSHWSWEGLAAAERLAKIEELGKIAGSRGLDSVFLADEAGVELALWSSARGATLSGPGS